MAKKVLSDALEFPNLSAAPATPAAGRMLLYSLSGSMYQKTSAGTATALDTSGGAAAAASFVSMAKWGTD